MSNRHIKIINGRKYYYQSIRIGKRVTSRYLGPVESRKKKIKTEEEQIQTGKQDTTPVEEDYIG